VPANDPRESISGYVFGSLTKSEANELAREALESDEVMQEIYEVEPLRDALTDPAFRAELKAALRSAQKVRQAGLFDRISAFFPQGWVVPSAIAAMAGVIIVGVIAINRQAELTPFQIALIQEQEDFQTKSTSLTPLYGPELGMWQSMQKAPPIQKAKAWLGLDRNGSAPVYAIGDRQRIGFQISEDARVVVLEERPDGTIVRLFPSTLQTDSLVRARDKVLVPPDTQVNLIVDGPPGPHKLRILLFPPSMDPLSHERTWGELRQNVSAAEYAFQVEP